MLAERVEADASVSSSLDLVKEILAMSSKLKGVKKYRTVFITPDRSLSQRAEHKQLVQDLKMNWTKEPNRKHFISNEIRIIDLEWNNINTRTIMQNLR